MPPTSVDALDAAIARGGHPSLISSRRYRRYEGRPGEIIERMSPAQRELLRELRSSDITEGKLGRGVAWLGYEGYGDNDNGLCRETVTKMLLAFDRKVLGTRAPRRMPRRITPPWS